MEIQPKDGDKFTKNEIASFLYSIVQDIMCREENEDAVCKINFYNELYNVGANIVIKRIKSIDTSDYVLFDLGLIGLKDQTTRLNGPVIVRNEKPKLAGPCNAITDFIVSTQDIAGSKTQLSYTIENEKLANVIKGQITNLEDLFSEVMQKIEENNSRYIEIEFMLDEPRMAYIIYIYIIKDKHLDKSIYTFNTIGSAKVNIVASTDHLKLCFDHTVENMYKDFYERSSDPAIMINYYTVSENKELI